MGNQLCCCKGEQKSLLDCNINNNTVNINCCDRKNKIIKTVKRKLSRQKLNDNSKIKENGDEIIINTMN